MVAVAAALNVFAAKTVRKAPVRKGAKGTKKSAPVKVNSAEPFMGPARDLWAPSVKAPEYLDGSMVGDRGFDPFGLSKPVEYLQFDLDALDQNKARNASGNVVGKIKTGSIAVSEERLQPYSEVFDIERFRECELIHGRWCMIATVGCLWAEAVTGVSWADAGKVEIAQSQWFNYDIPFSVTQASVAEALLVGGAEVYRNTQLDPTLRCYPGGAFDPLGLATDPVQATRLKEAEIKHGRLAMVAFFGFGVQALTTGNGPVTNLGDFADAIQIAK